MTARDWVARLGLVPHPEGGYFKEIYRAGESIPEAALPPRFGGPRAFAASIYFLLEAGQVSRLHRLKADEVWHSYDGAPLLLHILEADGRDRKVLLGRDAAAGQALTAAVPAGRWFGAELAGAGGFGLVGCTTAPAFEYADFELGRREDLLRLFPALSDLIIRLTSE